MRLTKICARHLTGIRGIFLFVPLLVGCAGHYGKERLRLFSPMCELSVNHTQNSSPSALLCNCALTLLSLLVNLVLNLRNRFIMNLFAVI